MRVHGSYAGVAAQLIAHVLGSPRACTTDAWLIDQISCLEASTPDCCRGFDGAVGEEVVTSDEGRGGRELAAVVKVLADLALDVGVALHQASDGKIGHVEAAVEPGNGVQRAVGIVRQEETVTLRCRDRVVGADSVAVLDLIRQRCGVG